MTGLPSEPAFPPGELRYVYLHWTAGDYATTFAAYHYCIALAANGRAIVAATHDPRDNMRDVRADPQRPYAAHTRGRNSFALGIAICAMRDATPAHFGNFPITEPLLERCCAFVARACAFYAIPVAPDRVRTHAEAAVEDGYFGSGEDERWDIARLHEDASSLQPGDAALTGESLRSRIREARA